MASGDTLLIFTALSNEPPSANYATFDVITSVSTDADESINPVLDFADSTNNEHAEFSALLPAHYAGGGLTLKLAWTANNATGNVKWDATFKSLTDDTDNIGTKAFGVAPAGNTVTGGAPSVAREVVYDNITVTDGVDMNSVAAGEYFRLRITRDQADAADTMTGDAELIAVYVTET